MFKRILLPTDGSEQSERAVIAGIKFAKELDAEVIGLTVIPKFHVLTYKAEMLEETPAEYERDSRERAARYLGFILATAGEAGVICTTEQVVSDDPDRAIVAVARERGCDLIVMGSHGRRGIQAVLLGSVTQKVLVQSSVPVLVYR
ncbi:MAG: sulfate transporter [Massilia sp.]|jgi:nucleotide-binding universal stress UspA family protein|nr:sulfate transporter [Massilia sp.]